MSPILILVALLAALFVVIGSIIAAVAIRRAPEAIEDENGLRRVRRVEDQLDLQAASSQEEHTVPYIPMLRHDLRCYGI